MATGKVEVNNLNLGQGGIPEIERHLLYIGRTDKAELQGFKIRIANGKNFLTQSNLNDNPLKKA